MKNRTSLLVALFCLTVLFIGVQIAFFIAHYKVSTLVDSIASSSIASGLGHKAVLLPILTFVVIQLLAYCLFTYTVWFIAVSLSELYNWSSKITYLVGVVTWCLACDAILILNGYYYPDSFFAQLFQVAPWLASIPMIMLVLTPLTVGLLLAFYNYIRFKRHIIIGSVLLLLIMSSGAVTIYNQLFLTKAFPVVEGDKPNIIIIGLDSLRPDYTGFFGSQTSHTPNIDQFLSASTTFKQAYTPLARTFPSWVSILTGEYPKHHHARINLADPTPIIGNDNLAKELRAAGYETMRGTDESRFSNITEEYGFDHILGPKEGAADFLLGGLTDFPLTNLLVNLPLGQYLFPYNYGNRAAAITYQPTSFLRLVAAGLAKRPNKPLFLAVHLCLPHWPFTWARDGETSSEFMAQRYQDSVHAVDRQFGQLLTILKADGLLENSMVVLLSDHGVALALPGDNVISQPKYLGPADKLSLMKVTKYSTSPDNSMDYEHDYGIDTSYGQGTDVTSLKQHHVLLAIRGYHVNVPAQKVDGVVSLIDVAPTLMDYLKLHKLSHADGQSLMPYVTQHIVAKLKPRPIFMETADKVIDIETNKIIVNNVVKNTIQLYCLNPETGLLYMNPLKEKSIVNSKERAILLGNWLLARFPAQTKTVYPAPVPGKPQPLVRNEVIPPYYVLVNLKTGEWTIGLNSPFAKTAPVAALMRQLKAFYGAEV